MTKPFKDRNRTTTAYGTGKPPVPPDPKAPIETVVLLRRPRPKRTQTNPNSLANLRPRQKGEPRANQGMHYKIGVNREKEKIDLTIMAAVRRQLESSPQLLDEGARRWLAQYAEGDHKAREQLLDRLDGPVTKDIRALVGVEVRNMDKFTDEDLLRIIALAKSQGLLNDTSARQDESPSRG